MFGVVQTSDLGPVVGLRGAIVETLELLKTPLTVQDALSEQGLHTFCLASRAVVATDVLKSVVT